MNQRKTRPGLIADSLVDRAFLGPDFAALEDAFHRGEQEGSLNSSYRPPSFKKTRAGRLGCRLKGTSQFSRGQ